MYSGKHLGQNKIAMVVPFSGPQTLPCDESCAQMFSCTNTVRRPWIEVGAAVCTGENRGPRLKTAAVF